MRSIHLSILLCLILFNLAFAFDKQRDCKCLSPNTGYRVVNGKNASDGSYPWQLSLQLGDSFKKSKIFVPDSYKMYGHICGAVLLNHRWALTAGHCVDDSISKLKVGYGQNDLVKMFDSNKYVQIEHTIVHPEYKRDLYFKFNNKSIDGRLNDIALLKLKMPISFDFNTQPACIGNQNVDLYDGVLKVTGWGSVKTLLKNEEVKTTRFLQEASVYDKSNSGWEMCKGKKKERVCVDNEKTKESACKGDSGGPLHEQKNGKSTVIGLTSFGEDVDLKDGTSVICTGPTAYTRISSYIGWIESHIGDEYCI